MFSFKKLFVCYFFAATPFIILTAILSLTGVVPILINNKNYTGLLGFVISLLLLPIIALCLSLPNWIFLNIGNFISNLFLKKKNS